MFSGKIVTFSICVFVTFINIACHGMHFLTIGGEKFISHLSDRDNILTNLLSTTQFTVCLYFSKISLVKYYCHIPHKYFSMFKCLYMSL